MLTANASALRVVASFTKSRDLSVGSSTENSSPGPLAPSSGVASSHPGDALAAGLLLIFLFAAALLIPFERLIPQEPGGSKSSLSTSTDSQKKKRTGGTEGQHYE